MVGAQDAEYMAKEMAPVFCVIRIKPSTYVITGASHRNYISSHYSLA